jgi:hypothetical protein
MVRAGAVVCATCGAPLDDGAPMVLHSQGNRPAGAGLAKYLRVHKLARRSGDPEATCEGRSRIMTAGCWTRWNGRLPSRPRPVPTAQVISIDDAVLAELGGRRKR